MRILVVDDEPTVRDSLDRALRLDGYEVELAAGGEEGLTKAGSRPPDAIVLDVLMGGMDGLETCRELRARGARTPVLMLTARDAIGGRGCGRSCGGPEAAMPTASRSQT